MRGWSLGGVNSLERKWYLLFDDGRVCWISLDRMMIAQAISTLLRPGFQNDGPARTSLDKEVVR